MLIDLGLLEDPKYAWHRPNSGLSCLFRPGTEYEPTTNGTDFDSLPYLLFT